MEEGEFYYGVVWLVACEFHVKVEIVVIGDMNFGLSPKGSRCDFGFFLAIATITFIGGCRGFAPTVWTLYIC